MSRSGVEILTLSCANVANSTLKHSTTKTESSSNHYPMHTCSPCILTSSTAERRSLYTQYGFSTTPPTVTVSPFHLLFKGSCQNKRVSGRKKRSSFPLLLLNKMAHCNSKSKYMFSVGALLFRLLRPVQGISLKYGNEYRGFFKKTHSLHLPQRRCMVYFLFSLHHKWAGE